MEEKRVVMAAGMKEMKDGVSKGGSDTGKLPEEEEEEVGKG